MTDIEDEDGIDGPWERRMDEAMAIDRKSERWKMSLNAVQNVFAEVDRQWDEDCQAQRDPGLKRDKWVAGCAKLVYELAGKMGDRQA